MKKLFLAFLLFIVSISAYAKDVYVVNLEGVISSYTFKYLKSSMERCENDDAALLIKLDTPGGLLTSTREIVQLIFESNVPVAVYVSPQGARAGSAGTFLVLAADFAAMAEGTNIGAAHPVSIGGKDIDGDMRAKIENDTAAFIRSIAEKTGRNPEIAVQTVLRSLSLTAIEAKNSGLIDEILNNDADVIRAFAKKSGFDFSGKTTVLEPTPLQKVAFFLSDPNVLILLLFIGILAIALEIKMPGTFIFAVVGIVAIFMFLMGINIIPINYLGLVLLLLGLALIVAEIFLPSFGLLTLGSVVSMIFGMYLLFSKSGNMGIRVSPYVIVITVGFILVVVLAIGRLIIKDFKNKPATGSEGLVGETGKVTSWEHGQGKVFVHGEIWRAMSDSDLHKDDEIVVVSVENLKLEVKKKDAGV